MVGRYMPLKPTFYVIINVKDSFCKELLSYLWPNPIVLIHDYVLSYEIQNNYSPRNIYVDMTTMQ